jgi:hypothetical protein
MDNIVKLSIDLVYNFRVSLLVNFQIKYKKRKDLIDTEKMAKNKIIKEQSGQMRRPQRKKGWHQ